MEKAEQITFPDRSKLISLAKYHREGGELTTGMKLIVERNFRSELKEGTLISHQFTHVPIDLSGNAKYAVSSCRVDVEGKILSWPMSMIYINLNKT